MIYRPDTCLILALINFTPTLFIKFTILLYVLKLSTRRNTAKLGVDCSLYSHNLIFSLILWIIYIDNYFVLSILVLKFPLYIVLSLVMFLMFYDSLLNIWIF